jgi:hypothetical protein
LFVNLRIILAGIKTLCTVLRIGLPDIKTQGGGGQSGSKILRIPESGIHFTLKWTIVIEISLFSLTPKAKSDFKNIFSTNIQIKINYNDLSPRYY